MSHATLTLVLLSALPIVADERTFSVTIDDRPAGKLILNYQVQTGGTTAVTVRADWQAERPKPVSLEYRGTEVWKDDRLVRLDGLGAEDGRKGGVTLVAGKSAFALKAGVKEVSVRGEVWCTTGVRPPDPDGKPLVVDVISGDVLKARAEKVGADRVVLAGRALPVTHYRVTAGGRRWDVWYDEKGRLAKRVWTRDGRTVIAEWTGLKPD